MKFYITRCSLVVHGGNTNKIDEVTNAKLKLSTDDEN